MMSFTTLATAVDHPTVPPVKHIVSRIAIAAGTALLFIALVFGLIWLSTHQGSLSGAGPLLLVIGLAAMVYGARSKKPPATVIAATAATAATKEALAAVTGRTLRDEADMVEGHIATAEVADAKLVLDQLYQHQQDRFASNAGSGSRQKSGEKLLQFEIADRPVKLRPVGPLEDRNAQPVLNPEQRVVVDVDQTQPVGATGAGEQGQR